VKKESSILLLVILLMAASPAIPAVAEAQTSTEKVRFRALAVGPCLIGYGAVNPGWPNYSSGWCGIGKGIIRLTGYAEVSQYPETINPWWENLTIYIPENLRARGFVSARWREEDGVHVLIAILYSNESTQGLFIPETDEFSILLNFKAIHIAPSGIQRIKGIAIFIAAQISPPEEYPISIGVHLIDLDLGTHFAIGCVPEETTFEFAPELGESYTVPPAKVFQRNVKLISST